MKINIINIFLLIFWISFSASGQTIYFYGINNRPETIEKNAITKIVVTPFQKDRFETQTFRKVKDAWQLLYIEKIKIKNDIEYQVRKFVDGYLKDRFNRFYYNEPGDKYRFVEIRNTIKIKTGITDIKIPLCLEGDIVEYFDDGSIKSKSVYQNNQLLSNENWLKNGEKYIDNIYYSVDINPTYEIENGSLQTHMFNQFIKYNLHNIFGTILLGFVIMETGELAGVHIIQGVNPDLDRLAVEGLESFPGKWKPAVLNNANVRCFCTMPINFKQAQKSITLDYLEYSNGVLFY